MRRISKHFQGVYGISFKRAVKDQESGESEIAFNLLARKFVDLLRVRLYRFRVTLK
jgi:hypothetical protein